MTRLVLEVNSDRELALLMTFLKSLNVRILKQEVESQKETTPKPDAFYKEINVDLTDFKFNREEANER
jgi:hypothetical protein